VNATEYLSLAAIAFGLAAILGATFAIFRSKQTQANLELLRAERDDLMRSNERLRTEQKEAGIRIEVLENERAVLRGVVTQEQAIKVLTSQLADHHDETMAAHHETLEVLERIAR
jgi:CRISPR/Cas system-associated endonuclease Cas3-HD